MIPFPTIGSCLLIILAVAFVHALITVLRRPASRQFRQVRVLEIALLLTAAVSLALAGVLSHPTFVTLLFLVGAGGFLLFTVIGLIYVGLARNLGRRHHV